MENDPVDTLMRQTNYTREQAKESLERNKTMELCIQEYLGVVPKPEPVVSVNQGIFRSIRDFINNSS
jgi:hypothetical protein